MLLSSPLRSIVLLCGLTLTVHGQLDDLKNVAIQGWWTNCDEPDTVCGDGTLQGTDQPVYLDYDSCYSNPNYESRSVSFLHKEEDGSVSQFFHLTFSSDQAYQRYAPASCDANGVCDCNDPPDLGLLRNRFKDANGCVAEDDPLLVYDCFAEGDFDGYEENCYVPRTVTDDTDALRCAMGASLVLAPPADGDNPDDGTPDDGTPDDGTPDDGIDWNPDDWNQGPGQGSGNGNPDTGTPDDGTPDDGNPDDGTPDDGIDWNPDDWNQGPGQGNPNDSNPDDSNPDAGTPDDGTPDDGIDWNPDDWNQGPGQGSGNPDDGTPDDGTPDDGTPDDGTPDDGTPDDGIDWNPDDWNQGPGQGSGNGNPSDSNPDDGTPDDGTPDDGNPDDGIDWNPDDWNQGSGNGNPDDGSPPDDVNDPEVTTVGQEDLNYAAIHGWWTSCANADDVCGDGFVETFEKPVYLDYDHCYSNPAYDGWSVSFLHKENDGSVSQFFHITFTSVAAWQKYGPTNCDAHGVCSCSDPPDLVSLRATLKESNGCREDVDPTIQFDCFAEGDFEGYAEECYVPRTVEDGDKVRCAMGASLILASPETITSDGGDDTGASSIPSAAPGDDQSGADQPEDQSGTPGDMVPGVENNLDNAFGTAITSWWLDCDPNQGDFGFCTDDSRDRLNNPIFINYQDCYSNPGHDGLSVAFFGKNKNGDMVSYSLLFDKDVGFEKYGPQKCDENGVCDCNYPPALGDLKDELVQAEFCDTGEDYACISEEHQGIENDCYVPLVETFNGEFQCSMAASLQVLHTVEVNDRGEVIPPHAKELFYVALTGWWNGCTFPGSNEVDVTPCDEATNIHLDNAIYFNTEDCYINPYYDGKSVTFFGAGEDGPKSYHLLFSDELWDDHKPDCDMNGVCDCPSNDRLLSIRTQILDSGSCADEADGGYTCVQREFIPDISEFEDCYVPDLSPLDEGGAQCSMVASIERKGPVDPSTVNVNPDDPGEAEEPQEEQSQGGKKRASKAWRGFGWFVFVVFLILAISFAFLYLRRYRFKRKRTGIPELETDEIWVQPKTHDAKYTSKPVNHDEDGDEGDGLFKRKSNINDLRLSVMS